MKTFNVFVLALGLVLLGCGPKKPSQEELVDLNNSMVSNQMQLIQDFSDFFDVVKSGDHVSMRTQLEKWEKDTDDVITEIESKEDYEETKKFKEVLMELAETQHDFVVNEAEKIVVYFEKITETGEENDEELNELISMVESFEAKMGEINDKFIKEQKAFAEKNNITLTNN